MSEMNEYFRDKLEAANKSGFFDRQSSENAELRAKVQALELQIGEAREERDLAEQNLEKANTKALERNAQIGELRAKVKDAERLNERLQNALNKIHDLAGQMGEIHPNIGAIQAWIHEVSPCKTEKQKSVTPVDERACPTCGGAGLRDIGHAPCTVGGCGCSATVMCHQHQKGD